MISTTLPTPSTVKIFTGIPSHGGQGGVRLSSTVYVTPTPY